MRYPHTAAAVSALRRRDDLRDLDALIDHRPDRDEAGAIFDAGDTDAFEVTGIRRRADAMARTDDGRAPGDLRMRLDQPRDDRRIDGGRLAGGHIRLLHALRDDQLIVEVAVLSGDAVEQASNGRGAAVLGLAGGEE